MLYMSPLLVLMVMQCIQFCRIVLQPSQESQQAATRGVMTAHFVHPPTAGVTGCVVCHITVSYYYTVCELTYQGYEQGHLLPFWSLLSTDQ